MIKKDELPEEGDKDFTETSIEPGLTSKVLLLDNFDEVQVGKEFRDFFAGLTEENADSRMYVYTPVHMGSAEKMGLFGDFAPSVVYSSNVNNKTHFPYRERHLTEFGYSKLCHLYCTLDKSVMFGFFNRHMAKSKIFNLNSVARILHRPELVLSADELENKEISEQEIVNILFKVKKNATKLLKEVQTNYTETQHAQEEPHSFSYPKALEELLGKNVSRMFLYGSSARGKGNDFDNIVAIQNLPDDFYQKILRKGIKEEGKEVGVIFVPENLLDRFLYVNVSNTIFRSHSRAIKGSFDFPIESERYKLWKEHYHAGFGSAKLISSLNLVFREPEILFDKPGLFEYFMKLNRFTLNALLQKGKYEVHQKEELLDILKRDFDFEIPKFRADGAYVQESFLKANKVSVDMARKMYDSTPAREENEHLLTLKMRKGPKIYLSEHEGKPVYVFGSRERIRKGDVLPVKILMPGEESYANKRNEIYHRNIDASDNFLVGKRV
jgi:predicted nucleotidyltransferase